MANSENSPKIDYSALMERYEMAAVAAGLINEGRGQRLGYAVSAMGSLYKSFGVDSDPIIAEALSRAQSGLGEGHLTDSGVIASAKHYAEKFEKAINEGTVGDFLKYALTRVKEIPNSAKELIEKYSGKKITDLDKKDKEQGKVLIVVGVLRSQIVEGALYPKLVNSQAKGTLEAIVSQN